MSNEPRIEERSEQPYAAITVRVTINEIATVVPPLIGEVFGWIEARGVAPAGPPFWKYNVIDMDRELEIEAGVGVAAPVSGDDRVRIGTLPAGRYATVEHEGHPDTLLAATTALLDWAEQRDLKWDVTEDGADARWTARLEFYLSDPAVEPDMDKWVTQLAFRLAD